MEIEKVIGSGNMGMSKASRITAIAVLAGVVTASFILGLWILGILLSIPALATLILIPVSITDADNTKNLYLRMAEEFNPQLQDWNRYSALYKEEKDAIFNNMLKKIDRKALAQAFYNNKEYSIVLKENKKGSLGCLEQYRIKFKGNRWSMVHVEIKSDIEVWRQARTSALKIK